MLRLSWDIPKLVVGVPNISYSITYQSEGGQLNTIDTTENSIELSHLSSGTGYNITLVTIGPQNLTSEAITQFAVTSKFHKGTLRAKWFETCFILSLTYPAMFLGPNPVLNLQARPTSTSSVEVTWSYPHDAQPDYKYHVQLNAVTLNKTVYGNSTEISNLDPGTRYNISVIVEAAAGSQSTEKQTHTYTSKTLHSNV